jgi:hypothetical protein
MRAGVLFLAGSLILAAGALGSAFMIGGRYTVTVPANGSAVFRSDRFSGETVACLQSCAVIIPAGRSQIRPPAGFQPYTPPAG